MPVTPEYEQGVAYSQGRSAAQAGQVVGVNPYVQGVDTTQDLRFKSWLAGYSGMLSDLAMRPPFQVAPPPQTPRKFVITNAQVLAGFTTPVALLPVITGRAYIPERLIFQKPAGVAFTIAGVTAMRIVYTGGVITVASIAAAALAGFLDQAAAKTVLVNLAPGPASFSPYASIPLGVQAAGQGLNFDFTGANPAAGSSPINIEMEYRIYDDGVLSF